MANATPRDTRAGFDLYRAAGGSISLDGLNEQLIGAGYGPVAQRTLTHYRHLVEAKREMIDRLRESFPESELTDDEIAQRVDEHVLPHLRALGRTGVTEMETTGDGEPDDGAMTADDDDG